MAVPLLHRTDTPLGALGPFDPAQRYWRGNAPERDVVARSVDGRRLLVGEVKWTATARPVSGIGRSRPTADLPGAASCINQRSAWFLAHRLRVALSEEGGVFSGPVEVDETHIGDK